MSEYGLREQICLYAGRLWERGLIGGTEGNISCRLEGDRLLVTPAGVIKADLEPEDVVMTDRDGTPLEAGTPSSEIKLHCKIYRERADCNAIVHAHPVTATAFALSGRTIPDDLLPEAGCVLGSVALAPFAIPGTDEVGDAVTPFLKDHKTLLLSNHGAVTLGASLQDAYVRMETLERVSRIVLIAETLGGSRRLAADAMTWLRTVGLTGQLR